MLLGINKVLFSIRLRSKLTLVTFCHIIDQCWLSLKSIFKVPVGPGGCTRVSSMLAESKVYFQGLCSTRVFSRSVLDQGGFMISLSEFETWIYIVQLHKTGCFKVFEHSKYFIPWSFSIALAFPSIKVSKSTKLVE
jgi:hypothetical protein